VSRLIYEEHAQRYEVVELSYYSSTSAFVPNTTKTLQSFEDWVGQYGPSGEHL
jgi:hypothetical protein